DRAPARGDDPRVRPGASVLERPQREHADCSVHALDRPRGGRAQAARHLRLMKLWLITIGRSGRVLEPAITEYETRARRYWPVEVIEVKEERARRGIDEDAVRDAEGERLLKRVPKGAEIVALTRRGDAWSSERLSRHIQR